MNKISIQPITVKHIKCVFVSEQIRVLDIFCAGSPSVGTK